MSEEDLREQLGRLVRQLVREEDDGAEKITAALRKHLGGDAGDLPVLTEELQKWELPNLQLALDTALGREGWRARILGLSAHARHYGLGLGDLVHGVEWGAAIGPPEDVNAAVGPGRTLACLAFAVVLADTPDGSLALFVRRGQEHGPMGGAGLSIQATASRDGVAEAFLADLRRLMDDVDGTRLHRAPGDRHQPAPRGTRCLGQASLARTAPVGAARHGEDAHRALPRVGADRRDGDRRQRSGARGRRGGS